jgi:hypothetical protein
MAKEESQTLSTLDKLGARLIEEARHTAVFQPSHTCMPIGVARVSKPRASAANVRPRETGG